MYKTNVTDSIPTALTNKYPQVKQNKKMQQI